MSTEITTFTEQAIADMVKQELEEMKDRVGAPPSNKINTKNKRFRLPNGDESTDPMHLVIVDFIYCNDFYEGAWDPDNPQGPTCFSRGYKAKDMIPNNSSPDKQSETGCNSCVMNEFGSHGRGKACKNTIKLAVLPVNIEDAPIMTLNVSPTAINDFTSFANDTMHKFGPPLRKAVVEVSFDPKKDFSRLMFKPTELNPNYEMHTARLLEAKEILEAEPMINTKEPINEKPVSKAGSRRRA